jgi:hypothetical protein
MDFDILKIFQVKPISLLKKGIDDQPQEVKYFFRKSTKHSPMLWRKKMTRKALIPLDYMETWL